MHEIKFRGKRVGNGEWVYGWYIKAKGHWNNKGIHEDWIICQATQNGGWFALGTKYPVIPETVGQFTGLHDKNGQPIYEGDRLKRIGDAGDEIFIIEWNEQSGGFNLNYIYFDETYDLEELWPDSEVIGTIHDKAGDE